MQPHVDDQADMDWATALTEMYLDRTDVAERLVSNAVGRWNDFRDRRQASLGALHIDQQSAPLVPGPYPIRARPGVAGANTRRPPWTNVSALRPQPRRPCRSPRSSSGQQGRVTGLAPRLDTAGNLICTVCKWLKRRGGKGSVVVGAVPPSVTVSCRWNICGCRG
jgi:hypothetical protein